MTKPDKTIQKGSAINGIFIFLILSGILSALVMGTMDNVTKASFEAAGTAVKLAIGLVGAMALWLGLMKVVEKEIEYFSVRGYTHCLMYHKAREEAKEMVKAELENRGFKIKVEDSAGSFKISW